MFAVFGIGPMELLILAVMAFMAMGAALVIGLVVYFATRSKPPTNEPPMPSTRSAAPAPPRRGV